MDWMWVVWIVLIAASFAALETYAFKHPDRQNTLSRAVSTLGERWPLSIALFGLVVGILLAHFFWPWSSNPLGTGVGGILGGFPLV